jgi:glyoxylase-like metal-dependent hydrolase (beta-lactamase superfamily II)
MTGQIDRTEGRVMPVNAFLVHGPDGVVVVDGMLTVTDAALVRQAIDDTGYPLAGVVVTHPHPDHYAGLAHLVGTDDVAIVATNAVDAIIRRDDQLKDEVVGPMMGDEVADQTGVPQPHPEPRRRRAPRGPDPVSARARPQRDARLPGRRALAGMARHPRPCRGRPPR